MKKISFCCNLLVCQSLVEQFISYYFQAVNREMKTSPWQRRLFEFILTSNFCFSNYNLIFSFLFFDTEEKMPFINGTDKRVQVADEVSGNKNINLTTLYYWSDSALQ